GEVVVEPMFDSVGGFVDGYAPVTVGQQCGYASTWGDYVILN
ncbi:MAG: WG repeat-containing protein, partial [Tidjanibacter sp.]|nr:WG repeat-containing protein [Tidjanibacter sp.]